MSNFTCNLSMKETLTQLYFCEFSKFLKIFQKTCKCLVLDFEQFYISHSIIHFIKGNNKKGNYYFMNVFNRISASENYHQKKYLLLKMQLFAYFLQKSSTWNHSLGHEMNEWIKLFKLLWLRQKLAISKYKNNSWANCWNSWY